VPPRPVPKPALRRQSPESVVGSGALTVTGLPHEQGGVGQVLFDQRSEGIWAQIVGQPDPTTNAYAFVLIDDGAPGAPTPVVGDAAVFGDGSSLAAFERSGSLTVPTDGSAVVRLEPLTSSVGYGFTYAPAGSVTAVTAQQIENYYFTSTDTWEPTGLSIDLPAAGTYLISGTFNAAGTASALSPTGNAIIFGAIWDTGAEALLSQSGCVLVCSTQTTVQVYGTASVTPFPYTVDGPTTLQFQGQRYAVTGAAWSGGAVWGGGTPFGGSYLTYVPLTG
jgi:hypothetical protein